MPARIFARALIVAISLGVACLSYAADAPKPLLEKGKVVDWWFAFKFNTKAFPSCDAGAKRVCPFGGEVQDYSRGFSQQYAVATQGKALKKGNFCLGDTVKDPLGATFDQVFNGSAFYVIWNDQFYNDPDIPGCKGKTFCDAPWAHSKGMLTWNEDGDGFVLQVTTPNWPGAGSKKFERSRNGNTLGCITNDDVPQNNVWVSQHFFALKLNKADVLLVLDALQNAGVVTDHDDNSEHREQIVNNGGPSDIQDKVNELGLLSKSKTATKVELSTGVQLISKPAAMNVPPWQMVSALLGGVSLRVATWYSQSKIPDTEGNTKPECWDDSLGAPGPVKNITTGSFAGKTFGLAGGPSPDRNHAKIGVAASGNLVIFGDMNQEGTLDGPKCKVKQNARGGLFYVVRDGEVAKSLRSMMKATE